MGWLIDASFGIGGTLNPHMFAYDISWKRKGGANTWYKGTSYSAGFTFGFDVAPEIGFWTDINTALAGKSHGFVIGGSSGIGAALSFWWQYKGDGGEFLGVTIAGPQFGAGVEAEYTRGKTTLLKKYN